MHLFFIQVTSIVVYFIEHRDQSRLEHNERMLSFTYLPARSTALVASSKITCAVYLYVCTGNLAISFDFVLSSFQPMATLLINVYILHL